MANPSGLVVPVGAIAFFLFRWYLGGQSNLSLPFWPAIAARFAWSRFGFLNSTDGRLDSNRYHLARTFVQADEKVAASAP